VPPARRGRSRSRRRPVHPRHPRPLAVRRGPDPAMSEVTVIGSDAGGGPGPDCGAGRQSDCRGWRGIPAATTPSARCYEQRTWWPMTRHQPRLDHLQRPWRPLARRHGGPGAPRPERLCFPDPIDVAITPDGIQALVTRAAPDRVAVVDLDSSSRCEVRDGPRAPARHSQPHRQPGRVRGQAHPHADPAPWLGLSPDGATAYVAACWMIR